MAEKLISGINTDYYNSKKKIYTRNVFSYKISNKVEKFDKEKFAAWMREGFANSKFKTQKELVDAAKSNPATISRLMSGSKQTTTDKASQPTKELVIKLAKLFDKNVDEALILAGHAPTNSNVGKKPETVSEFIQTLSELGFDFHSFDANTDRLTPDDLQDLIDNIKANLIVKVERRNRNESPSR